MGGFTGLFDRPDPYVTSLTKNRNLQVGINATGGDWTAARNATQGGLGDYIRKYLANQGDSEKYAGQETGAISRFYNGDMAAQLAALRAKRSTAVNAAADVGVNQALRNVDLSRVGGEGGSSSYDKRLAIGAVTPIRTQAALDNATQERADTDYLTGNQIALSGARSGIADRLAGRALVPGQASFSALKDETGGMAPVVGLDQSNKYYGIKQDPGLLDRMQQEVQFLQGLQSIMKNQYGTVSEAGTGWAGGGMGGGGGGGGMGGMMGGMGGMGMRRGGMVGHNYVDHITDYTNGGGVEGPGSGTSDSIPARLSNGEFVVPARAVRMPGVLALLEKIRAMGNEGPTTARMAGGGLYYADSFGDLGHQALARDAFNESVVGGQVQQIQQQQQFDASRGDQQQQSQDANARSILSQYDAWKNKRGMGSAGGYQSMSGGAVYPPGSEGDMTFSRGGYVSPIMRPYQVQLPYADRARALSDIHSGENARAHPAPSAYKGKFADGGVVGYADGGRVDPNNTRVLLHQLAQKAASEMLSAPAADTIEQQRLQFEQGRAKVGDQRADRQLQMNEQYQQYLMKQPTAQAERSTQVRDAALVKAADQGISPDDNPELAQGASPEGIAMARQHALSVRPSYEAQRDRSVAIANLKNRSLDVQKTLDRITAVPAITDQEAPNLDPWERGRAEDTRVIQTTGLKKMLDANAAQLSKVPPTEQDQNAYFDVGTGRYVPAVPEPHWRGSAKPVAKTRNQGFEGTETERPTAMRSGSTAQPAYAPKFPPQFYSRVNELVSSGMDARQAKSQAMMEMQAR